MEVMHEISGALGMKIIAITPFPAWVGIRNQLLVKVETDEGIYGWGESGLSGREKAVVGAIEHYARVPDRPRRLRHRPLWQEMYRSQYFEGGRVLHRRDLGDRHRALRHQGQGARGCRSISCSAASSATVIPTFATTRGPCGPDMIEQAQELIAMGWTAIRLFPAGHDSRGVYEPRESIAETARWCVKAREELGDEWCSASTITIACRSPRRRASARRCRRARSTSSRSRSATRPRRPTRRCARLTDVPFAIGEEFASKWQFLPYIERDIHQFNRIDVCNVGGLTEAMKVAGWSEAHYVDMMPHNPLGPVCTAATVHFAAAVANFAWLETRATPGELTTASTTPGSSRCSPASRAPTTRSATRPGLGVEVDEALVRKQSFRFWEAPHLRRTDGSVTNW